MRIHIQHLAREEQPRRLLAHHRARRDFQHIDAAPRDDGLLNRPRADDVKRKRLERTANRQPLLARHLIDRRIRVHAAELGENRRHARGHQPRQHGGKLLADVLGKIALQPHIDLFFRQAGLHIQRHGHLREVLRRVAAQLDDQRAAYAEMREKHLPQLAVNRLLAHLRGDSHILERQPLQERRPFFIHRQADQRRAQLGDIQPVFLGEHIAVTRAARRGIAHAAGRDDHALGAQRAALRQLHVKAAFCLPHMGDLRVQRNHNARVTHPAIQRARHVARLVALRKDAAATLNLGRRAEHLQQPGHILVRKLARRRV